MSADVLAPSGALASSIPHYEDRPEQRAMAAAVTRALAEERALLVEAGTGTGKTLAYLVPALTSGKRVVVSTGTRTLQEQIWRHDIPLLREVLPHPFEAAILKGVSNYVCRRRLSALAVTGVEPAHDEAAALIHEWAGRTSSGDRAELEAVADDSPLWARVTTTPETRLGRKCPHYERCFVTRARRAADEANLILVNHHLFFADLALRSMYAGARVLPEYEAVVFDEAHQLEDVLTDHFGVSVSTARLVQLCRDARQALRLGDGPLLERSTGERILGALERRAGDFFGLVGRALRGGGGDAGRIELTPELLGEGPRQEAWFRLDTVLDDLRVHALSEADGADPDRSEALVAIGRRATAVREDLALLAEQRDGSFVYWGERRTSGVFLNASPIEVGGLMRRHVLGRIPAVVFTSATLSVAGRFDYVRARLGLSRSVDLPPPQEEGGGGGARSGARDSSAADLRVDAGLDVDELCLASPFDYQRQALLYLPGDLPEPREDAFIAAASARIAELLEVTEGRTFVLFTSHRALGETARRLDGRVPYPLLIQGREPRASLVERFRACPGSVLLGTGSFWEGVDVPGDALSQVIIDKLPFAPPTDPLVAARMRRVEGRGTDAFHGYQLPQAALILKQGFGRLIRRRDDRGIVTILDRRILGRAYGQIFLDSLPDGLCRTGVLEQVRRWWRAA